MDCAMDGFIRPEGWDNWRDPNNEATAYFGGEIGFHRGPGAKPDERALKWSHQLTPAEAAAVPTECVPARVRWLPGCGREHSSPINVNF